MLRVDGDNSSGSRSVKVEFGNWSVNQNITYTAAYAIVNEEQFAVSITHINVSVTSGTYSYLQIWLHGNGTLKADNDATSVFMYNNGTVVNGSDTVAWTLGKGDQNPGNMSTGDTNINTTWDETAHVRYSNTSLTAYGVGTNGRTVENASDFVWVQISIVPESASTHTGTVEVHFEASTHWDSAGSDECECGSGHTDNGDGTYTATFNSSSSDGTIYNTGGPGSYSSVRDAGTGIVVDTNEAFYVGQALIGGFVYRIDRGFVFFITSSIPSCATINSANLSLYGHLDSSDTDFDIVVQNGQPTYPNDPLQTGDYDRSYYSGVGGNFNSSNFIVSAYNNITLNSTGISWINIIGMTKLCLRSLKDINGNEPSDDEHLEFKTFENSSYKPRLIVTYTP